MIMKRLNRIRSYNRITAAGLQGQGPRPNRIIDVKAEELKSALVKKLSADYAHLGYGLVYQAVNEAHALASLTTVPLLFLPLVAEEKVQKAGAWSAQQRSIREGNHVAFAA